MGDTGGYGSASTSDSVTEKAVHTNQEATVRTEFGETDNIDIGKGVRQGCNNNNTIIQLYFRPQWVHRKDNTKYAEHVNITQITKIRLKHVGLSQFCEVIQGCNSSAVQFRCDMYITVNYTMCNQIKGDIKSTRQTIYRSSDSCLTTIDIRGCKHGTCTAPHRQTTQDTKRIIIRYNKLAHASLSIGDP